MVPATPSSENPALQTFKAILFAVVGVGLMVAAGFEAASTHRFVARAHSAAGEVMELRAGGAHPTVRFVADDGRAISYAQNGMIWGYRVGDRPTVLYDPRDPSLDPVVDNLGALYGFTVMNFLLGAVFVSAAWTLWREGRAALSPPPLPRR